MPKEIITDPMVDQAYHNYHLIVADLSSGVVLDEPRTNYEFYLSCWRTWYRDLTGIDLGANE